MSTKLTEIALGGHKKRKKLINEAHGKMYGIVYPQSIGAFSGNAGPGYKPRNNQKSQLDRSSEKYVKKVVSNKDVFTERIKDDETRKVMKRYLNKTIQEAENTIKEAKKALEQIDQIAK